jgi:hypothetical protein
MYLKLLSFLFLFGISFALFSCGGSKSVSSHDSLAVARVPVQAPQTFKYRFYFYSLGSLTRPHDEIWIDTNGQMTFDTQQHMHDGSWKSPRGMAYLEPRDEDSLLTFIRQDALFSIDEADVTPQCPDGDQYKIRVYRSDLKKQVSFNTNTCASEFNLLVGQQRKLFPGFIAYIERLRVRYRPLYTE